MNAHTGHKAGCRVIDCTTNYKQALPEVPNMSHHMIIVTHYWMHVEPDSFLIWVHVPN